MPDKLPLTLENVQTVRAASPCHGALHLAVIGAADADNFLGAAAAGTAVTLTATPDAGFLFVNWSGARISNAPTCTVTVNANATVQANFAK